MTAPGQPTGSGRIVLKSAIGAARHRLTGHRVPLNVVIAVTRRCNALCTCCASPMRPGTELETHELLALVDQLARAGTVRIGVTGGEPLVREDLGAILDRCRAHGIWTTVETNGYAYPERAEELAGIGRLMVSLDGTEAVHDRLREPGSWRKAVRAIEVARARGVDVQTITVLSRHNVGEVDAILRLAEGMDVSAVFQVLQPGGPLASRGAARHMATDEDLHRALQQLLDARDAGRPVAMSEKALRYLLTWEHFAQTTSPLPHEDVLCMAGQVYCAIDADGGVYPCLPRAGVDPWGNLRTDGFAVAFSRLRESGCRACTSTACTEYNFLYNLNGPRVVELARSLAVGARGAS